MLSLPTQQLEPLIRLAALWGLAFGGVFCLATLVIGRINAEMLLNDYPPDVQARFGKMRPAVRRQANWAGLSLLVLLLAVLTGGLLHLRAQIGLTWLKTFVFLLVVLQLWNLIDLIVLDWFLLVTLQPRFMILPGTEDLAGYRDYRFHLAKFGRGLIFTTLLAGLLTVPVTAIDLILSTW